MTPFRLLWVEVARSQYQALPTDQQQDLQELLSRLVVDPGMVAADYDRVSDQWLLDFAGGAGLVIYAVVPANRCIIVLRLVTFG